MGARREARQKRDNDYAQTPILTRSFIIFDHSAFTAACSDESTNATEAPTVSTTSTSVDSLSYLSDGHYLAAGLAVGGTWVKEMTGETEPVQFHRGNNSFVAADPNRSILATGNRDGLIWLWSMLDEPLAELSDGGDDYLWGLTVHPSGEQVASLQ